MRDPLKKDVFEDQTVFRATKLKTIHVILLRMGDFGVVGTGLTFSADRNLDPEDF